MFWRLVISWQWVAVVSDITTLAGAAPIERVFDWRDTKVNETPKGFRSVLSGSGLPGDWKVLFDEISWPGLEGGALGPARAGGRHVRPALGRLSRRPPGARYPMVILLRETFSDFRARCRFKIAEA